MDRITITRVRSDANTPWFVNTPLALNDGKLMHNGYLLNNMITEGVVTEATTSVSEDNLTFSQIYVVNDPVELFNRTGYTVGESGISDNEKAYNRIDNSHNPRHSKQHVQQKAYAEKQYKK